MQIKLKLYFCLACCGVPVLCVVAGLLWGQWTGQPGHLYPDGVVQVFLTGVNGAGDYERHSKQTGPVLLR